LDLDLDNRFGLGLPPVLLLILFLSDLSLLLRLEPELELDFLVRIFPSSSSFFILEARLVRFLSVSSSGSGGAAMVIMESYIGTLKALHYTTLH
jgi:hypothetical protein